MKFKLKSKFTDFLGNDIMKIGDIIEPNENGIYDIKYTSGNMTLDIEGMKTAKQDGILLFEEVKEKGEIDLIIQEIPDDDDNLVGNWRIQLDVKTTRKKLKKFEKIFRETIDSIL